MSSSFGVVGRERPPHLLDASAPFHDSYSPSSSSPTLHSRSPLPQVQDRQTEVEVEVEQEGEDEVNIFRDMSLEEILEDLNARFLINLPKEEMSLVRVYWQAEQAHWFYEDYLRPLNPSLPSLSQRSFTRIIIESSPLYAGLLSSGGIDYDKVWEEYCGYKRMVPCCGGILLNTQGDKCLVVRGYKSNAGWSFPRGKINLDESEAACAIREVEEETGFDLTGMINPSDSVTTHINAQKVTMFIILGVDEDTVFETQTRNEIGAIEWVKLTDLPTWSNKKGPKRTGGQGQKKFYNVTPFVTPLKKWLNEHGIDPYARPKKKAHPPSSYRDLQPYQFESPPLPPASPLINRGSSALDHLFARFIHKQEEELEVPEGEAVVGSDNKAGMERLFGNLNVLKAEEQSIHLSPHSPNRREKSPEEREREKKEDVALARLLGAMGGLQTPAPDPPRLATTQNQSNLLAMLNQRSPPPLSPTKGHYQHQHQHQHQPQRSQGQQIQGSPSKPHQAKLLAMISPPTMGGNVQPPSSTSTATTSLQLSTPNKPMSLPTSPRPPSPSHDTGEVERRAKARALLDMTLAGIGIDVPAKSTATTHFDSFGQIHGQGHLPPAPAAHIRAGHPGPGPGAGQRVTPPGNLPPTQPIPPSSYGHYPTHAYRPISQPLYGQSQVHPPPPSQPQTRSTSNIIVGSAPVGFSSSPTKMNLPPPPPPYEHSVGQSHGQGQGFLPFVGVGNGGNGYEARPVPQGQNRPGQPIGPNSNTSQGFRPISQPLPPHSHSHPHGHVPYPPGPLGPPGGVIGYSQSHLPPPAGPGLPGQGQGYLPAQQFAMQGYPSQAQPQRGATGPSYIPIPNQNQNQGYQTGPLAPPPAVAGSYQHGQYTQQRTPPKSNQGVQVPPQGQGQGQGQVYHPVPRPPAGSGPSGLLAMLNSGTGAAAGGQGQGQGR